MTKLYELTHPVNSVVVEIIQNRQAVLVGTTLLQFAIVWLGNSDAAVFRPIVLASIGSGGELLQFGGPEPSVDGNRLQVGTVASLEVTQTSAGPDVLLLQKKWEEILT